MSVFYKTVIIHFWLKIIDLIWLELCYHIQNERMILIIDSEHVVAV